MLDYLACCLELLLTFVQNPANQWRLFLALPVLLLIYLIMKSLLYFIFLQFFFLFILTYWRPSWIMDFLNWLGILRSAMQREGDHQIRHLQSYFSMACLQPRRCGFPWLQYTSSKLDNSLQLYLYAKEMIWSVQCKGFVVLLSSVTYTAIPSDRHVILLDMPGHGRSTQKIDFSYSFMNQSSRVAQFVIASGLGTKPFHLIGISMGGGVAIAYAATHPRDVSKLSLLCPAGLNDKVKSDYMKDIENGQIITDSGKMPLNAEEQHKAFSYMFYFPKGFKLPRMYSWLAFEITKPKRPIHGKVSNDLETDINSKALHKYIPKITSPTLVIWGKHDRLVHPSGADVLKDALPNCEVHMLQKCGHTISYDRPFKAMKLVLKFDES